MGKAPGLAVLCSLSQDGLATLIDQRTSKAGPGPWRPNHQRQTHNPHHAPHFTLAQILSPKAHIQSRLRTARHEDLQPPQPFDDIRRVISEMPEADLVSVEAVRARDRFLTKPPGSLGRLEEIVGILISFDADNTYDAEDGHRDDLPPDDTAVR